MADSIWGINYCEQCGQEIGGLPLFVKRHKFCSAACREAWLLTPAGQAAMEPTVKKLERIAEENKRRKKEYRERMERCLYCPFVEYTQTSTWYCMFPQCPRDTGTYDAVAGKR